MVFIPTMTRVAERRDVLSQKPYANNGLKVSVLLVLCVVYIVGTM